MTNEIIQITVPAGTGELLKAAVLLIGGGAAVKWRAVTEGARRLIGAKYSVHLCERLAAVEERLNKLEGGEA